MIDFKNARWKHEIMEQMLHNLHIFSPFTAYSSLYLWYLSFPMLEFQVSLVSSMSSEFILGSKPVVCCVSIVTAPTT